MSRKRKQHTRHKPASRPKAATPQPSQSTPQWGGGPLVWLAMKAGGVFLVVCTVLGVLLWWPFYVVNIRIDISSASNDLRKLAPPSFSVTNAGVFEAYAAEFLCYYKHASLEGHSIMNENWEGTHALADVLHGNQSVDVTCADFQAARAQKSDIVFLVSFRPAYAWRRSYACTRFVLKENAYGNPQWFRMPPDECKPLWLRHQELDNTRKAEREALRKIFK